MSVQIEEDDNHRLTEWFGLEETLKPMSFHPLPLAWNLPVLPKTRLIRSSGLSVTFSHHTANVENPLQVRVTVIHLP